MTLLSLSCFTAESDLNYASIINSVLLLITVKLLWHNLYCMKRYRKVTWLSGSSGITHRFHQALSAAPLLQVMAEQSGGNLQERGGGRTCRPIRGLLGIPEAPVNQSWSAASAGRGLNQRGVGWRCGRRCDPGADGASRRESCSTRFLSRRRLHLHKKTWCHFTYMSQVMSHYYCCS